MNDLILHPTTSKQLEMALRATHHGFLFAGPDGLGKTVAAKQFAAKLMGEGSKRGDSMRWLYTLSPVEGKKISIAQVREMAKFAVQSKSSAVRTKVVIIDQAENIGIEAQNALLLMLEDAPADTVFIVVASSIDNLASTLVSRLQTIRFYEPTADQMQEFILNNSIDAALIEAVGNLPAKLLDTDSNQESIQTAKLAEYFMGGNLTDRLLVVSEVTDKNQANKLLVRLANNMIGRQDGPVVKQGESLLLAQSHLYNNGNPRFVLETLALEFE